MATIWRLNWPFYAVAAAVLVAAVAGFAGFPQTLPRLICAAAAFGALYFLAGSLGVSHLIYDRSDLYRWRWIDRALHGASRDRILFCHSGFDEASELLRAKLGDWQWQVLDHFDDRQMTEPSIRRARALFPPTSGTLAAPFHAWPVRTEGADVVFGILAIHELRSLVQRRAWFGEARRCLKNGGRVVLVEHLRDLANFVAFGPGFFHFHSRESWRQSWEAAGLKLRDEFRITPWVSVFVLSPS